MREIMERERGILGVLRQAGTGREELNAARRQVHQQERDALGRALRPLHDARALRAHMRFDEAVTTFAALASPESFWLLVDEQGWSPARWGRWFGTRRPVCCSTELPRNCLRGPRHRHSRRGRAHTVVSMSEKSAVLSIFPDEAAAEVAVKSLQEWDKSDDRVKLNAIGVLVLDDNGDVKLHKMGSRNILKGGGIGLVLALLVPPVGVAAGIVAGGLLGALHHKGLGLTEKDRERINGKLFDGKAAVGVLAKPQEARLIAEKMIELGGEPEVHAVSDAALKHAETEMPLIIQARDQ
jgi:uncharacterized membrane protein